MASKPFVRQSVLLLLVFINQSLFAQRQEPLYYFIINDSLVGVKDKRGKIIIPAKYRGAARDYENGAKVSPGLIDFFEYVAKPSASGAMGSWKTFDRDGHYLYQPYIFEFQPDEVYEGLSRFTENGKIGYANREGKKIIPAQFDFAGEFTLGTATFCNGCYRDTAKDIEHPPLVAGVFGIINRQGRILMDKIPYDPSPEFWSLLDSLSMTFYEKKFQYTAFEKSIIKKLDPYKAAIEKVYFTKYDDNKKRSLVFDIVEKPSADFPYYVIYSREFYDNKFIHDFWDKLEFHINKEGKIVNAFVNYDLLPFEKWYVEYVKKKTD